MKICPNCRNTFSDDCVNCDICGNQLQMVKTNNKKTITLMIALGLLVSICIIVTIALMISGERKKREEIRKEIKDYRYEKEIEDYLSTPLINDLKINSDWTTRTSNNYLYISGSVTNISMDKTISYYEIEAKFYDKNGNVIDSDWTNWAGELEPGESRQFEIMYKYTGKEEDIDLKVREVK